MIDPTNITNFSRTQAELEEFLLFCGMVAGKKARRQAVCLENFLQSLPDPGKTPFERIQAMTKAANSRPGALPGNTWTTRSVRKNAIAEKLMAAKTGQYDRLSRMIFDLTETKLDLRTISIDDLIVIEGIGPKTARYFVLHSRPGQQLAVLDTHILKFMRGMGFLVPFVTPSNADKYALIESIFLYLSKQAGKTPAAYDLEIWNEYSAKANGSQAV